MHNILAMQLIVTLQHINLQLLKTKKKLTLKNCYKNFRAVIVGLRQPLCNCILLALVLFGLEFLY